MTISLSYIVNTAAKMKDEQEQVEWLKKHNSVPLRNILALMYNKEHKFNIPNKTKPPYTPSGFPESTGALYREARKLRYFVVGYGGENLPQARREALFIQMLESVDKDDALLLVSMLLQKPIKGLAAKTIVEALGPIIPMETKK